ncbi:hypothetical protein QBZ16_001524 [Prototheca wickerhamii]|uniref:Protein kinase domain-containing protein n=1 Tax=Prototheca wickerhamii TaxID=3111 RepID=A0AAD9MK63_PROWI|nr:hypothetical protein QBZ16_001524 [Prototheca wickerhamii]
MEMFGRLKNAEDGRDAFKALARQGISGDSAALLFLEWAALELQRGHGEAKAAGVLGKGLREGAQPLALLETAAAELAAGTWRPVPLHDALMPASATAKAPRAESATVHSFSSASSRAGSEDATICMPSGAPDSARLAPRSATGQQGFSAGLSRLGAGSHGEEETIVIRRHRPQRAPTPLSEATRRGPEEHGTPAALGAGSAPELRSTEPPEAAATSADLASLKADPPAAAPGPPARGRQAPGQGDASPRGHAGPRAARDPGGRAGPGRGRRAAQAQGGGDRRASLPPTRRGGRLPPLLEQEARVEQGGAAPGLPPGLPPGRQLVLEATPVPGPRGGPRAAEEDDTAPVVLSSLALKIQRGRQSIAPALAQRGQVVLESDTAHSGSDADATRSLVNDPSPQNERRADVPGRSHATAFDRTIVVGKSAGSAAVERSRLDQGHARVGPRSEAAVAAAPRSTAAAESRGVENDGRAGTTGPAPREPPRRHHPTPSLGASAPQTARESQSDAPARRDATASPAVPASHHHSAARAQPHAAAAGGPSSSRSQAAQPAQRRVVEDENSVMVKGITYTKLECVGRGGSSKVFKVMAPNRKIFALKRIRLTGRDSEAAAGFMDEITLLKSLRGRSNIIQLIDAEVYRAEGIIYMVLECGEIDLARLLQKREAARREQGQPVSSLDENFIRLYWEQMLTAVHTIHEKRIVHSDIKPANFLVVEGQLKLIDFGIAKAIQSDTTSIARESQVGTLNYMSPEAILGGQNNIKGGPPMKAGGVGRPSDIWSLGCILYQMVYGSTPFSHLPFIQKMHAITDPNHVVAFPPVPNAALLDVLQRCLDRNPRTRITMRELLAHAFLRPDTGGAAAGAPQGDRVELSREQLERLLRKVAGAGVESPGELDSLSQQVFAQLCAGVSPQVGERTFSRTDGQQQQAGAPSRLRSERGGADTDGPGAGIDKAEASEARTSTSSDAPALAPPPPLKMDVASAAARAAAAGAERRAKALLEMERGRTSSGSTMPPAPAPPGPGSSVPGRARAAV